MSDAAYCEDAASPRYKTSHSPSSSGARPASVSPGPAFSVDSRDLAISPSERSSASADASAIVGSRVRFDRGAKLRFVLHSDESFCRLSVGEQDEGRNLDSVRCGELLIHLHVDRPLLLPVDIAVSGLQFVGGERPPRRRRLVEHRLGRASRSVRERTVGRWLVNGFWPEQSISIEGTTAWVVGIYGLHRVWCHQRNAGNSRIHDWPYRRAHAVSGLLSGVRGWRFRPADVYVDRAARPVGGFRRFCRNRGLDSTASISRADRVPHGALDA